MEKVLPPVSNPFGLWSIFEVKENDLSNAHSADAQNKKRMKNDGKKKPDPIRVNARLDGAQAQLIRRFIQ